MCFVAAFIKEYSLFSADMTCLGKKVETRVQLAFANGRWKHSFDTMLIFYELDAAAESIYICPQEILVGYPCKKTGSYPHYPQGYPLFGAEQAVFYVDNGCDSI